MHREKKKLDKIYARTVLVLSLCVRPVYADAALRTFDFFFCSEKQIVKNSCDDSFWHANQANSLLRVSELPALYIKNAHNTQWFLSTNSSFVLTDLARNKKTTLCESTLLVAVNKGAISINGKVVSLRALQIASTDGLLVINGVSYRGTYAINGRAEQSSVSIMGSKDNAYASLMKELVQLAFEFNKSEQLARVQSVIDSVVNSEIKSEINSATDTRGQEVKLSASFKIKVLLDQSKEDVLWHLSSNNGFVVWGSLNPDKKITIKSADIYIHKKNKQLFINNQKYSDDLLYIAPLVSNATFNGTPYHGAFLVSQQKDQVSLINNVDLEEYVYGVLHTESWPGWPLEIHKVCAIACRSYAIAMALRAHKLKKIYHLTNTNKHQTYSGLHNDKVLRQAVDDTRGVFIAYNNQPIIAMYDICCGGIIPAHIANFNFQNAPYLAREYACSHCKICKTYAWETVCPLADFEGLVSKMVKKVKNVKSVVVSKKDKAGLVREVVLKNSGLPVVFSGQKMYSLMKEIKSLCFQTRKEGNRVIIKGRGFGHHLGLCQWGAREMVRNGWKHRRILQFYYPGTDFMRIT